MDRKEYLIKILEELTPIWNLARGLKILVEQGHLDNNLLETLSDAIEGAIHTVKDTVSKNKLQKSLDALQRMRQMEEEAKRRDEDNIRELDKILENI